MGDGYKAIFNLEMRLEVDTGKNSADTLSDNQGYYLTKGMAGLGPTLLPIVQKALQPSPAVNTSNAPFDRTSMVGLITPAGAIMAGRMYTPGYEIVAAADTFEAGTAGGVGGLVGGAGGFTSLGVDIRSEKSVQYRIKTASGISSAVMYGVKNPAISGCTTNSWAPTLHTRQTDSTSVSATTAVPIPAAIAVWLPQRLAVHMPPAT